jgi:Flp pilus assembly protein TadG
LTWQPAPPRRQRGQAIVLIALMLAVLIGMVALAVDGARGYAVRRDLQAAVDASALAAGDSLQRGASYSAAESAATAIFSANLRLYGSPSCTPYGSPGAAPYTVTCSYSDGTVLTQTVSSLGPQGSSFSIKATRQLRLQFARVLTNATNPTLVATGAGSVNNLVYSPAVEALGQSGCGGAGGNALSVSGAGTLDVNGDVAANGAVSVAGASLRVAGDIYARCQSTVLGASNTCYPSGASPPCSYPDVAGATRSGFRLVDPGYPEPPVSGGSQPSPGDDVVLSPGSYPANPSIPAGRCYFLSGGVYRFSSGYTSNGGFVSNELKPPDEPVVGNNKKAANPQFWDTNGVNCSGAIQVTVSGNGGGQMGTWGVEVTSTRIDSYAGANLLRESAPSRCESFGVHTAQTIQLDVSNVPGAQAYNIYLSSNSCAGPFGLVSSLAVQGSVQNRDTSGCPFGNGNGNGNGGGNGGGNGNGNGKGNKVCTLGSESLSVPAIVLPSLPLPNLFAPPGTSGAYPPDGETAPLQAGLPNQNPDRATPPAGDRANENQCATAAGVPAACPGNVTPGAVALTIPNGGCVNETNTSDNYIFSGYQYNWIAMYEPGTGNPPANSCANRLGAAGNSAAVGLVYFPSASVSVSSSDVFDSEATGGLIASQVTFSASPSISFNRGYAPAPPASRLSS